MSLNPIDYKEMTIAKINEELTFLPDMISGAEYTWEVSKIELDAKEAKLINEMPPELKNAEQRKSHVNLDVEYFDLSVDSVKKKTEYHKLLNRKDCVIEIAQNKRAELRAHMNVDIKEQLWN